MVLLAITCLCLCEAVASADYAMRALEPFIKSGEVPGAIVILQDGAREEIPCIGHAAAGSFFSKNDLTSANEPSAKGDDR